MFVVTKTYHLDSDSQLLESFFRGDDVANHPLFQFKKEHSNSTVCLYHEPDDYDRTTLRELASLLRVTFHNIEYSFDAESEVNLPDDWLKNIKVYFVIGLPPKVNHTFRNHQENEYAIMVDLNNILDQYEDVDDAFDAVMDYVRYSTVLIHLDTTTAPLQVNEVMVCAYSMMNAAYADYLAKTNQAASIIIDPVIEKWAPLEYELIRHVLKKRVPFEIKVEASRMYISTVLGINREMVLLGTLGKVYFSKLVPSSAKKVYDLGPLAFYEQTIKDFKVFRLSYRRLVKLLVNIWLIAFGGLIAFWGYLIWPDLSEIPFRIALTTHCFVAILKCYVTIRRYPTKHIRLLIIIFLEFILTCLVLFAL